MIDISPGKVIKTIETDKNGVKITKLLASSGKFGICNVSLSSAVKDNWSGVGADYLIKLLKSNDLGQHIRVFMRMQMPNLVSLVMTKDVSDR